MSDSKPVARKRTRPAARQPNSGGHDPHKPIGYANPPKAGQFKKGQSGNPKGRPKGRKGVGTILIERLYQKVTVRERGRERSVPLIEAKLMQLTQAMLKGDEKATALVLKLFAQYGEEEAAEVRGRTGFTPEEDQSLLEDLLRMELRDTRGDDQ